MTEGNTNWNLVKQIFQEALDRAEPDRRRFVREACGGDLDRLVRVVKLVGFVNSTGDFGEQPKVINGASDFMVEVFAVYGESMANHAFTPPLIAEWGEISNALWPRLQAAVLGDMTAQEALDEAAEDVLEVMEDAGYL